MPNSLSPEERIRMLIGLDGTPVPAPSDMQWSPPDPITPIPQFPMPRMYDGGMMYVGEGDIPPGSSPMTDPENWKESITTTPPSKRELVAAALRKRKAMGY